MTTAEAVVAGTSGAAAACALEDVGRVAPGQLADLLVVDGDPLKNLKLLAGEGQHLSVIMKGGRFHKNRLQ